MGEDDQRELHHQDVQVNDKNVLHFLDSIDHYLTLLDSVSSTLRQGWLGIASARHSMGASRVSGALLDLKLHPAATSLQITQNDVDSLMEQPHFILHKWKSTHNGECCSGEEKASSERLKRDSDSTKLRRRGTSQLSDFQENNSASNGAQITVNDQVQKERAAQLSVFGTLVSPKLRSAQLSFETALETLVEIANIRSSILCTFDQVKKELEGTKG